MQNGISVGQKALHLGSLIIKIFGGAIVYIKSVFIHELVHYETIAFVTLVGVMVSGSVQAQDGGFQEAILQAHNQVRANHNAPALSWSNEVTRTARNYADVLQQQNCAGSHSPRNDPNLRNGAGENLYSTGSSNPGFDAATVGRRAVEAWYWCEIGQYPDSTSGHYSQVVWSNTTEIGCAFFQCGADFQELFPEEFHVARVICQYSPPGNFRGSYEQNVRHRADLKKPDHVRCF